MFDIGIGEIILLAAVGLLIFGPEKLPHAAADAAKWVKQIRAMATGARKDLADSAGIDFSDSIDAVKSLQDLHPRRLAASILQDDDDDGAATRGRGSTGAGGGASGGSTAAGGPAAASGVPEFDPDAT